MTIHGYRDHPAPPRPRHRTVENLTTPGTIYAANGSVATFAFPCYYQEIHPPIRAHRHCKDWHDHVGVPSPRHPDHSCQPYYEFASWWTGMHEIDPGFPDYHHHHNHWRRHLRHLLDMRSLIPIHLIDEGYENVYVAIHDKPSGLNAEGWIDQVHDNIIKVRFDLQVEEAELEPKDYLFSVVIDGKYKDAKFSPERSMRDVAVRGLLHVDPCILTEYEE